MTETLLGRISSISARGIRDFLIGPGHEQNLVGGLVAQQAVEDLAVGSGDRDGFITADQAGTGIDDRLEQVALGANLPDFRQVRADISPR